MRSRISSNAPVYIIPTTNDRWAVYREGNRAPSKYMSHQYEAIQFGRNIAKQNKTQLIIQNRKGVMRLTFNYNQN